MGATADAGIAAQNQTKRCHDSQGVRGEGKIKAEKA